MNGKNIVGDYLPLSGGTLTGSLTGTSGTFTSLSVNDESVSTPMGVSVMLNAYLPKTGGTLSGGLACQQFNLYKRCIHG